MQQAESSCAGMQQLGPSDPPAGWFWLAVARSAGRAGWAVALRLAERFENGEPAAVLLVATCLTSLVVSAERMI